MSEPTTPDFPLDPVIAVADVRYSFTVKGATWDELKANIDAELARLSPTRAWTINAKVSAADNPLDGGYAAAVEAVLLEPGATAPAGRPPLVPGGPPLLT